MTTITALPAAPSRADPANFSTKADAFVAALPTFGTQCNAVASEVNGYATNASISAAVAIASANFKGAWSSLTGALAVPACVLHSSKLWLLVANVANVTAHTPGVSASWVELETLTHAATADFATNATNAVNATNATNATNAVTANTATVALNVIGTNQTWQTVTRSLGTTYQNLTGRSICLSYQITGSPDSNLIASLEAGGTASTLVQRVSEQNNSLPKPGFTHSCTLFLIVPSTWYYKCSAGGVHTLSASELR